MPDAKAIRKRVDETNPGKPVTVQCQPLDSDPATKETILGVAGHSVQQVAGGAVAVLRRAALVGQRRASTDVNPTVWKCP